MHGLFLNWDIHGRLQKSMMYENGLPNGICEYYDNHGRLESRSVYKDGKLHGPYEQFNIYGNLVRRREYNNGQIIISFDSEIFDTAKMETFKNTNNESCIICKENVQNMLQLECLHYGCTKCFVSWYKKNPYMCVYCKKSIDWSKCKINK